MKLYNKILTVAMLVAMVFTTLAYAQQDGWKRESSSMTYDTLYISDSAGAAQGNWFVRTKFRGDNVSDQVIWGKGGFDVPFEEILKISTRSFVSNFETGTKFKISLHHGDSTIFCEFVNSSDGPWVYPVYGPSTWSGTLSAFDSLSIIEMYHPFTTIFVEQITDFDNFRVTINGSDSLFYTAGDWGEISGTVWHDTLLNGFKDPLEQELAGWTLYLSGTTNDTAVTDTNGYYHFGQLPPGDYQVSLSLLPSWDQVYPPANYNLDLDPFGALSHQADFGVTLAGATKIPVEKGWNMVSLPVIPSSLAKVDLFPSAVSDVYWYNGTNYLSKDTLEIGKGYWLKFSNPQNIFMTGDSIEQDSMEVIEGWNMIGALSAPVVTSEITSWPEGMITSQFFGYNASYQPVDTLKPGQGYWVKTATSGKLYLTAVEVLAKASNSRIVIVNTNELPPPAPEDHVIANPPEANEAISQYQLEQNYPNPFNPTTVIRFLVPAQQKDSHAEFISASQVTLKVYNLLGQEVATLVDGLKQPGEYVVKFDATKLNSGIYFYRLQARDYVETKKLILIR